MDGLPPDTTGRPSPTSKETYCPATPSLADLTGTSRFLAPFYLLVSGPYNKAHFFWFAKSRGVKNSVI